MPADPFTKAADEVQRARGSMGLDVGVVVGVSTPNHMVAVKETTTTGDEETDTPPTTAAVSVDTHGDVVMPAIGDMVVLARFRNRTPVVLGTYYAERNEVPSGDGQRQIPTVTEDPDEPRDATIWYRDDLDEYRGVENGTVVSFDTTAV